MKTFKSTSTPSSRLPRGPPRHGRRTPFHPHWTGCLCLFQFLPLLHQQLFFGRPKRIRRTIVLGVALVHVLRCPLPCRPLLRFRHPTVPFLVALLLTVLWTRCTLARVVVFHQPMLLLLLLRRRSLRLFIFTSS